MEEEILNFLKSGKFLIIGFNSRPIIKSALNLSLQNIFDIDFFGDIDLLELTDNITVISEIIGEKTLKSSIQDLFYSPVYKLHLFFQYDFHLLKDLIG